MMEAHEQEQGGSRIGEVLGDRWRLVERLGGGGMGEVYRAVHLALGRTVAIKVLRPEHAWNAATARRVLREGQAASRVMHPNIVRIEDVGVDPRGLPYLVQEFLEGVDLDAFAMTCRGVVPVRELLPLMIPTLDALAALHDAGILHRDLKPGNVFVVREGGRWSPRLLDFGLASISDDRDGSARITTSKVTLGSPAYMSPEQFRDPRALTPRSDLWSFGVMLYELLSGVLPFEGATVGALAIAVSTEAPVPLGQRSPSLPPSLAAMVMRCLEKDPADRPASARELITVCEGVLRELPPPGEIEPVEPTTRGPALIDPASMAAAPFEPTLPSIQRESTTTAAPAPAPAPAPPRRSLAPWGIAASMGVAAIAISVLSFGRSPSRPEAPITAPVAPPAVPVALTPTPTPTPGSTPAPVAPPAPDPRPAPVAAPVHVALRPAPRAVASVDAGVRAVALPPVVAAPVLAPVTAPVTAPVQAPPLVASPLGLGIDPQYR